MNHNVSLISVTPDAEKTIGYIARVSNPNNQDNPKVAGLLSYCIKHGHWSVFEQASMTLQMKLHEVLLHRYLDIVLLHSKNLVRDMLTVAC